MNDPPVFPGSSIDPSPVARLESAIIRPARLVRIGAVTTQPDMNTLTIYTSICRLSQYGCRVAEIRPAAGHARRADPQDHRARSDSRLRRRAAAATDLARRASGPAGVALSGPSSTREARLGPRRVGGIGDRPRRAGLYDHARGPPAA